MADYTEQTASTDYAQQSQWSLQGGEWDDVALWLDEAEWIDEMWTDAASAS